jgi:hypothetical protein
MQIVEFTVPAGSDLRNAECCIESVCAGHGLHAAMKTSLASYPGSIHWHFKNGGEKGTLELTLLASDRRIWAQVHTGRAAPWIAELLPKVRRAIERELRAVKTRRGPESGNRLK